MQQYHQGDCVREATPAPYLNLLGGTLEFDYANGDAPVYEQDQRFQQKALESLLRSSFAFHVLQFCPNS